MSEVKVNKVSPRTGTDVQLGDAGDTVTVAGNDVRSNSYKAADGGVIVSQSGTTITLGASGDTITLACGATQTGFGASGAVTYCTTAKTAPFTAVSGNGYFVNTTSGAITVTLPASPSAGDIVAISDYARTFNTNNVTIGRNGSLIQGNAQDATISIDGRNTTFVYVDGTKGWLPTEDQTTKDYTTDFISATGGTIINDGNYKIHVFTGPATFCVSAVGATGTYDKVQYMVVGGGAGGGRLGAPIVGGGGGGAGGWRASSGTGPNGPFTAGPAPLVACVADITVSATGYPITIGAGGAKGAGNGSPGNNSIFSTITSSGGGGGGGYSGVDGIAGASGGGGSVTDSPGPATNPGGAGNTPPVSPPQGNAGGSGTSNKGSWASGGAGGGAAAVGGNGSGNTGGTGGSGAGTGIISSCSPFFPTYGDTGPDANLRYYAGGGGGASLGCATAGGDGGGGNAGWNWPLGSGTGQIAQDGGTNTGGGGGAGSGNENGNAGNGGSGVVLIRYRYQ